MGFKIFGFLFFDIGKLFILFKSNYYMKSGRIPKKELAVLKEFFRLFRENPIKFEDSNSVINKYPTSGQPPSRLNFYPNSFPRRSRHFPGPYGRNCPYMM
jgi:hypothetical protein